MIDPSVVDRIKGLLASGYKQRRIARMTGVSRFTIGAIARGRRPDYKGARTATLEARQPPFCGPALKCPGCGRRVQMPCLACRCEHERALKGQVFTGPDDDALELELSLDHKARYERIRRKHALPEQPPEEWRDGE